MCVAREENIARRKYWKPQRVKKKKNVREKILYIHRHYNVTCLETRMQKRSLALRNANGCSAQQLAEVALERIETTCYRTPASFEYELVGIERSPVKFSDVTRSLQYNPTTLSTTLGSLSQMPDYGELLCLRSFDRAERSPGAVSRANVSQGG